MPTSSQEALREVIVHPAALPSDGASARQQPARRQPRGAEFRRLARRIRGVPIRRFEHTLGSLQGQMDPAGEALERSTTDERGAVVV